MPRANAISCGPVAAAHAVIERGRRLARAALAALALVAAGACAGHQAPPAGPVPVRLAQPDVQALASILRFEDRREFDTTAFAAFARGTTPEIRRRAYVAAGRIGDPAARAFVRAGLRDRVGDVRAGAAFAAGLLRDTAAVPALKALISLRDTALLAAADRALPRPVLMQKEQGAAAEAVFALGRMNTAAAHDAVESVVAWVRGYRNVVRGRIQRGDTVITYEDHEDYFSEGPQNPPPAPPVVGQALLALWRYPRQRDDAALAQFIAFRPGYEAQRWQATYALMRLGDPAAVPALLRLVADSQPDVRALAVRGLRATVVDSAGQRAEAVAALTAALRDREPHVRINAAGALAGYRDAGSVAALGALLHDPDRNVGIAAAQALGAFRLGQAAAALQPLVDSTSAPLSLRAAALTSLVRVEPATGLERAAAWAAPSQPWRQRFYAASALEGLTWSGSPLYAALVHDPDSRVVTNAWTALQANGAESAAPRAQLVEALGAPDPFVRAAALGVLAARADPADLQLFLDSYARAARDTFDDAAVAAVDGLAALQKRGFPASRDFFARFTRSGDFVVRLHVAQGLGDGWGPPRPVDAGRTDAFYLEVVRRLVLPALARRPAPRVRFRTDATAVAAGVTQGEVVIELTAGETPLTVDNLLKLARLHFFDGNHWHRVVPNFVAQDGDPRGDGNGGPGWAIRDELTSMPYARGAFGMALSGPDTGGSQFFITLSPQPHLDAGYTVFGRVVEGMDVADRILQDDQVHSVEVIP